MKYNNIKLEIRVENELLKCQQQIYYFHYALLLSNIAVLPMFLCSFLILIL